MKFSERMGITQVNTILQSDGMSDDLRNSIWNVFELHVWGVKGFQESYGGPLGGMSRFSKVLWFHYLKRPIDSIPEYASQTMRVIRDVFYKAQWYEAYNFTEFVVEAVAEDALVKDLNYVLERELAGYRVIDGKIVPVTDAIEVQAIERALEPGPFSTAQAHIRQAIAHLANREHPDYRNSVKESISAVESVACELSGNPHATLGEALKFLERNGELHKALKSGFSAIYGYTSDADGIRHAMLVDSTIDVNDAKYFLVACVAFVNYLKAKST